MRGALKPVSGVSKIDIQEQNRNFKVTYDPTKVKVEDLLERLAKAKEPAKKKGS